MVIKLGMLLVFFAVMVGHWPVLPPACLGCQWLCAGRPVCGPWLTAFAYGTSYFSAVVFVGYAGQFGWKYGIAATWAGIGNAILGSLLAWAVLGTPHPNYYPAPGQRHYAGVFWETLWLPNAQSGRLRHHLSVFDSLHCLLVQRPLPAVWNGFLILTIPYVSWSWRCSPGSMSLPGDTWLRPSTTLFRELL